MGRTTSAASSTYGVTSGTLPVTRSCGPAAARSSSVGSAPTASARSRGTRSRAKLLEALAAGKAVVASPLAAAGLEVTDGRQLVLAESDEEFTEAVVRLLEDEERRVELARSAREWALRNLSWESRVEAYERLYESLLRERG